MPARAEVLGDGTIGREELLGVSRRLEPLHAPFPLAGLMRVLRAVVEIPMLAMLHPRQHLLLRRTIAFELSVVWRCAMTEAELRSGLQRCRSRVRCALRALDTYQARFAELAGPLPITASAELAAHIVRIRTLLGEEEVDRG
jgi:hypothetical protein